MKFTTTSEVTPARTGYSQWYPTTARNNHTERSGGNSIARRNQSHPAASHGGRGVCYESALAFWLPAFLLVFDPLPRSNG
jgi:hypothetical protein